MMFIVMFRLPRPAIKLPTQISVTKKIYIYKNNKIITVTEGNARDRTG